MTEIYSDEEKMFIYPPNSKLHKPQDATDEKDSGEEKGKDEHAQPVR